jgi:hypothetical protein
VLATLLSDVVPNLASLSLEFTSKGDKFYERIFETLAEVLSLDKNQIPLPNLRQIKVHGRLGFYATYGHVPPPDVDFNIVRGLNTNFIDILQARREYLHGLEAGDASSFNVDAGLDTVGKTLEFPGLPSQELERLRDLNKEHQLLSIWWQGGYRQYNHFNSFLLSNRIFFCDPGSPRIFLP